MRARTASCWPAKRDAQRLASKLLTKETSMSSLLQFRGQSKAGKVGLEMYLTKEIERPELGLPGYRQTVDAEELVPCTCKYGKHTQLYRVWRKPVGMFGCWVVFRYNGKEHAPDLSCPFGVEKLPRDAEKLSPQDNCVAWNRS